MTDRKVRGCYLPAPSRPNRVLDSHSFYRKVGALSDLSNGPFVAALDADANLSDCDEAHIVVTNIHPLAERADAGCQRSATGSSI